MKLNALLLLIFLLANLENVEVRKAEDQIGLSIQRYMHVVESADNDDDSDDSIEVRPKDNKYDGDDGDRKTKHDTFATKSSDKNDDDDIYSGFSHKHEIKESNDEDGGNDNGGNDNGGNDKKGNGDGGNGDGERSLLKKIYELLKGKHKDKAQEVEEADDNSADVISSRGAFQSSSDIEACGKNQPMQLTKASGSVMSPGFFRALYGNDRKCAWKLIAPVGKVVKITFLVMDVEYASECQYDSVQVWDVEGKKGLLLAKYCNKTKPMELLQSTGRYMFVYFLSDDSQDEGRFSFVWQTVDPMPQEPYDNSCGQPMIQPRLLSRIVNGVPATPHSWPWQVSVRRVVDGRQYHLCGGSVVSATVILTAAHCFFDPEHNRIPTSSIRVVAGDHDQTTRRDGDTQSPSIKGVKVHHYYNANSPSSPYDIAIILLSTALKLNKHISTVCLPREEPRVDDVCVSTGWGETQGTDKETILNQVVLPIISQSVCSSEEYYGPKIVHTVLCAGYEEGGRDACQGDSGGPFVCKNSLNGRWYLQGITSWGSGCAKRRRPGVYTRVNSYLRWIFRYAKVIA